MIKVGLTGGIGSGKSTVAKIFSRIYGIPVFEADREAKIASESPEAMELIMKEFGTVNKKELSKIVFPNKEAAGILFCDKSKLIKLNSILHPLVKNRFAEWIEEKSKGTISIPYVIMEAAILLESGSDSDVDIIITVEAEKSLRIKRVIERDNVEKEEVMNRMKNQFSAHERIKRSTYVIVNNNTIDLEEQIIEINNEIIKIK
jgi:dephospho-CoA kinase